MKNRHRNIVPTEFVFLMLYIGNIETTHMDLALFYYIMIMRVNDNSDFYYFVNKCAFIYKL